MSSITGLPPAGVNPAHSSLPICTQMNPSNRFSQLASSTASSVVS